MESGSKLGPYEIIAPVGAGGMGEVYKAKDTRLDRIVAIKILPERMRNQPQLVARFEQEAKAISRLNHPNICTLYDVGHEGDTYFLVMEFLEGESLSNKLNRGPLNSEEALEIAAQIADALDSAHGKKLIHRDLKPANVILTNEGPKLLDFGLAKFERSDDVVEGVSGVTRATPLTGEGTIIGTIQYMSPEQLEGNEADERSDIFAFGSTLYEMITGERAFRGKSQASLIAAILEHQPAPISQVKPMTPPGLDRLVRKCLEKDPEKRWQSVRDLADELRWISQSGSQAGTPVVVTKRRKTRFRLAWFVAIAATAAAVVFAALWFGREEPAPRIRRLTIDLSQRFRWADSPRISPDGRYFLFKGEDTTGTVGLWLRPLSSLDPTLIPGTAEAGRPFWSPDSRYFAFADDLKQLKKVPVNGGPAQLIGEFSTVADGTWGQNGIILVDGGAGDSIRQIPAGGGTPTAATRLDHSNSENTHAWPQLLPDGEHFFYLAARDSTNAAAARFVVKLGSLGSFETKSFFAVDSRIEYSSAGYLFFVRDKTLLTQAFDDNALEFIGEPVPIATGLDVTATFGSAGFTISDEGTILIARALPVLPSRLVWVDRQGRELEQEGELDNYGDISLSPDGRKLAYAVLDPDTRTYDLWVRDLERKVSSRLTFGKLHEFMPAWEPDGEHLTFSEGDVPNIHVMRKAADGSGGEERLLAHDNGIAAIFDHSRKDSSYCIGRFERGNVDIFMSHPDDSEKLTLLVGSPEWDFSGTFSPNGQYLAYTSRESGREQVYVRNLDGSGGRWQVSTEWALLARWRSDGRELFYLTEDGSLRAVSVDYSNGLRLGTATTLFRFDRVDRLYLSFIFMPANDGQSFLINGKVNSAREAGFTLIQDWDKEIEQR